MIEFCYKLSYCAIYLKTFKRRTGTLRCSLRITGMPKLKIVSIASPLVLLETQIYIKTLFVTFESYDHIWIL